MTDTEDAFWDNELEQIGSPSSTKPEEDRCAALAQELGPDLDTTLWVDPKTGEIVEPGTRGAVQVEAPDPGCEDRNPDLEHDDEWLPDYFTERLAEFEVKERLLLQQHQRRLTQLRANRTSFLRYYQERVEAVVGTEIKKRKRRSVDYAYGRLGFRKGRAKHVVEDKAQAIEWAKKNAPEAVKTETKESLLKSNLPKGKTVPGAKWVGGKDSFFSDVKAQP